MPNLTDPVLAVAIIGASFGYGFATRERRKTVNEERLQQKELHDSHYHGQTVTDIDPDPDNND